MTTKRIEGLPFLPGYSFRDPTITDYRRCHSFGYSHGYFYPKERFTGIGDTPLPNQIGQSANDLFGLYTYDPILTYGVPREKPPKPVVPAFVALEKKVLRFFGYYKETVNDSPQENYRVRHVEILYYLEDNSIMVTEPVIENSGLMQGNFLRRHRIPKNDMGEFWHWKDLNVKCDIMFYGRVFRVVDADDWTKNFYESEGIIMNDPEILPKDPYITKRYATQQKRTFTSPELMELRSKKYMEFEKKALRFKCVWDDGFKQGFRKFELYYHLSDECVEVNEILPANSGRDPHSLLLHKIRLPKDWKDLPLQFPLGLLEPTEHEIVEYYEPKDFKIGATISVFGRRMLIYDMDEFTRQFYRDQFGYTDFTPICIEPKKEKFPVHPIPPWNGWGSPEDSIQSWLHIVPKRPPYDAMKRLVFELKVLKFGAQMDSTRPEDQGREFTISYRLVDDKLAIYERPVRNSGWPGGKFLDYCRVIKPESSKDDPEYYGPHDLYIGAMLDVFSHRFCLNSADPFVLEFLKKNPDCFPQHVRENLEQYFECEKQNPVKPAYLQEQSCDAGKPVCEEPLGEGLFEHLGMNGGRYDEDPCSTNPAPCPMNYDWNMCRKLGYNCGYVPPEPKEGEPQSPLDYVCENPCPGNPDMFEKRECAVSTPERWVPPEPLPPNPVFCEDHVDIPKDQYYLAKERRFDCYNPPDADQRYEQYMRKLKFGCPCPPDGSPPGEAGDEPYCCPR